MLVIHVITDCSQGQQSWLPPKVSWACELRTRAEFLGLIMRIGKGMWGKEQRHLKEIFMKFGERQREMIQSMVFFCRCVALTR